MPLCGKWREIEGEQVMECLKLGTHNLWWVKAPLSGVKDLKDLKDLKGVSLGYVGRNYNLKDLKDQNKNLFGLIQRSRDPLLRSERKQGFSADPFYCRARCLPMLGSLKT